MILLAALLSFGWPPMKTEWVPAGTPCPIGMSAIHINPATGSMRPYLSGSDLITAYAEPYHGQPVIGYIVSDDITAHQVVAESKDALKCSGSNNRYSDAWKPKSAFKWVVKYVVTREAR